MPRFRSDRRLERDGMILLMRGQGETYATVGRAFNLTGSRVHQICKRGDDPAPINKPYGVTASSPVADLTGLTGREIRSLERANIATVGDLITQSDEDLLSLPGFGRASLNRVHLALRRGGITKEIVSASVLLCCTLATTLYDAGLVFLVES